MQPSKSALITAFSLGFFVLASAVPGCGGNGDSTETPATGTAGSAGSGTSGKGGSSGGGLAGEAGKGGAGASGTAGIGGDSGASGSTTAGAASSSTAGASGASASGSAGASGSSAGAGNSGAGNGGAGNSGAGNGGAGNSGAGGMACPTECCGVADCTAKGDGFVCDTGVCVNVAGTLAGLRWELPCGAELNPDVCVTSAVATQTSVLGGSPGKTYDVTFHFRGVVEEKTYTGGTKDGSWHIGGAPAADDWNIYRLEISSPPQVYFLNSGTSNQLYCVEIDYTRTVPVATGATVKLTAEAVDAGPYEIKNQAKDTKAPIVVSGVVPAPAAYVGQFIQMDVDSVVAK